MTAMIECFHFVVDDGGSESGPRSSETRQEGRPVVVVGHGEHVEEVGVDVLIAIVLKQRGVG